MESPQGPEAFSTRIVERVVNGAELKQAFGAAWNEYKAAFGNAFTLLAERHFDSAKSGPLLNRVDETAVALAGTAFRAGVRFGAQGEALRRTLTEADAAED